MQKRVTLVGLGYVGLPLAALLAAKGFVVKGVDTDPSVVSRINAHSIQTREPGLDSLVREGVRSGALSASVTMAVSEVYVIAVPTPLTAQRTADLSHIRSAVTTIAPVLKTGDLLILESTSPIGTTEQVACWLAEQRPDLRFPGQHEGAPDVHIAYCPERVLPGSALRELEANERVIGGLSAACTAAAADFYGAFVQGACLTTDSRTAEMCKLAENSFRDVNIAYANELSMLCERMGVDTRTLISLANRHPRVAILEPGPGVGGHCVAVDPVFLQQAAPDLTTLISAARQVNDSKPAWVIAKVEQAVAQLREAGVETPKIVCLGLTFKPDIDDLRESPALAIAVQLAQRFPDHVYAVEPNLTTLPSPVNHHVRLVDVQQAHHCDVLVQLVNHREFRDQPLRPTAQQRLVDVWAGLAAQGASL
jgi:UDP-N-acetyl-D-mannosaminuronic acid dehydrogenase